RFSTLVASALLGGALLLSRGVPARHGDGVDALIDAGDDVGGGVSLRQDEIGGVRVKSHPNATRLHDFADDWGDLLRETIKSGLAGEFQIAAGAYLTGMKGFSTGLQRLDASRKRGVRSDLIRRTIADGCADRILLGFDRSAFRAQLALNGGGDRLQLVG